MLKICLLSCLACFSMWLPCSNAADSQMPKVYRNGNAVTIEGRFVRLRGAFPENGAKWCYWVTERRPGLYVFTFWAFDEFSNRREREGLFSADSWVAEIYDSSNRPEREIVFDDFSKFNFWGDVYFSENSCRVSIGSIEGLPKAGGMVMRLRSPQNR